MHNKKPMSPFRGGVSGHTNEKIREIILGGIRGFENKVRRRGKEGKPLFRTSKESLQPRQLKKLMGLKSWYRKKRKAETDDAAGEEGMHTVEGGGRRGGGATKKRRLEWNDQTGRHMPSRSVIFVDYTEDSKLAK